MFLFKRRGLWTNAQSFPAERNHTECRRTHTENQGKLIWASTIALASHFGSPFSLNAVGYGHYLQWHDDALHNWKRFKYCLLACQDNLPCLHRCKPTFFALWQRCTRTQIMTAKCSSVLHKMYYKYNVGVLTSSILKREVLSARTNATVYL